MAVTMQDIARDLKVSAVTVSKVLRNQGKISSATRRRVLQRAKQLNYQTNWIARSLVTRRTYTIGLLLPDFTHPFFSEIAKAIAEAIRPRGYHLVVSYFEEDPALEATELQALVARQVDGLIVASAQIQGRSGLLKEVTQRRTPLVLIDRPVPGAQASFVGSNNQLIGQLAARHLLDCGCRLVAHLRGPDIGIARERAEGFRKIVQAKGHSGTLHSIVAGGYDEHPGFEAMRMLLHAKPMPDGIFCYNDPVAIGAMKAILAAGLKIPSDIAVIGAGNVHYSDLLSVPLTTIDQQTHEIGNCAAQILLEQIGASRKSLVRKLWIKPTLIVRQSTRRVAVSSPRSARTSKSPHPIKQSKGHL